MEAQRYHRTAYRNPEKDPYRLNFEIDLAALIAEDTYVKPDGEGQYVARVPGRRDTNPSMRIWAPGYGRYGDSGWTGRDYSSNRNFTVIGYLQHYRGMSIDAARAFAWDRVGANKIMPPAPPVFRRSNAQVQASGSMEGYMTQKAAIQAFMGLYNDQERLEAEDLVFRERGLSPSDYEGHGTVLFVRDSSHAGDLMNRARRDGLLDLLIKTGIVMIRASDNQPRLIWWDKTLLIIPFDRLGEPAFISGRRLNPKPRADGRPGAKYMNPTAKSEVVMAQVPWGSQHLNNTERKTIIALESAFDAMAATQLGFCAMGFHQRPGSDIDSIEESQFGRWMLRNQAALSKADSLVIMNDQDDDPEALKTGILFAESAAIYGQSIGINAMRGSLADIDIHGVKDINEWVLKSSRASL